MLSPILPSIPIQKRPIERRVSPLRKPRSEQKRMRQGCKEKSEVALTSRLDVQEESLGIFWESSKELIRALSFLRRIWGLVYLWN